MISNNISFNLSTLCSFCIFRPESRDRAIRLDVGSKRVYWIVLRRRKSSSIHIATLLNLGSSSINRSTWSLKAFKFYILLFWKLRSHSFKSDLSRELGSQIIYSIFLLYVKSDSVSTSITLIIFYNICIIIKSLIGFNCGVSINELTILYLSIMSSKFIFSDFRIFVFNSILVQ